MPLRAEVWCWRPRQPSDSTYAQTDNLNITRYGVKSMLAVDDVDEGSALGRVTSWR